MVTVREVKLMKDGKMVTPVVIAGSVKNLNGTSYEESINNSINAINNKLPKMASVTLPISWANNTQTVNVTGMTATCGAIVTPAPDSLDDYVKCGVKATTQLNGALTFTCKAVPNVALTVNIVMVY